MKAKHILLLACAVIVGYANFFGWLGTGVQVLCVPYAILLESIVLGVYIHQSRLENVATPAAPFDSMLFISILASGVLFFKSFESPSLSSFYSGLLWVADGVLTFILLWLVSIFLPEGKYEPSPMYRLINYVIKEMVKRKTVWMLIFLTLAQLYLYSHTEKYMTKGVLCMIAVWIWLRATGIYYSYQWSADRGTIEADPIKGFLSGVLLWASTAIMGQYLGFWFDTTGVWWESYAPVIAGFLWVVAVHVSVLLSVCMHAMADMAEE